MTASWQHSFPQLGDEVDQLLDAASRVKLPADTTVFRNGDQCNQYILVLDGEVKVFSRAENGREIVLYRLYAGDTCVITTSCLMGHVDYPAEAVTATPVEAMLVPAEQFHGAMENSEPFRRFVFASLSDHLGSLISLVQQVAFGRLHIRLAGYLCQHAQDMRLQATHQQIATELGSAREVISRQLKEFEQQGWLRLQRGSIELTDAEALNKLLSAE